MTLAERVQAYAQAFPKWKWSWPYVAQEADHGVIYATWVIGNNYANDPADMGYPHGYPARMLAMFPDVPAEHVLFLSWPVTKTDQTWPLILADARPTYTTMKYRAATLKTLASMTEPGGHLVWLDTRWPIHSKKEWVTVGRIAVHRSTNNIVRTAFIFQRV